MKKALMSAVGSDLFSRSSRGSSMSSMSIMDVSVSSRLTGVREVLDFLACGAVSGVPSGPSEVVGETMMTLSTESKL